LGGTGEGVVEAEAIVLSGIAIMMSVHQVVDVVLVEEVMTGIIATMTGAGSLEAGVLGGEEDEAEALGAGEIGVQLGKAVLSEGQRLNNGIGKENRQNLLTGMIIITVTMKMEFLRMRNSMMILISSTSRTMVVTATD